MSSARQATVARIAQERISAIVRTQDQRLAADAMSAAIDGGFRIVEFTLTIPGAMELVREFSKRDDLVVGAGTVMTRDAARQAVSAGAKFLVSPIFDAEVVSEAASLGVACIPGAYTPTEMEAVHRAGADFVKVFPAPPGGIEFIEAIRAPLPHLRLFPTAGVSLENVLDFLNAGCAGVGFVKNLFHPQDMASRNFDAIQSRAAAIVQRVAVWKRGRTSN